MRRYHPPYNGHRYLLNRNTHEVHDLDRETTNCRINNIEFEHVYNCISFENAQVYSNIVDNCECNGCVHCMPERNND